MKLDKTLKWLIPALVVLVIILWMFVPWKCSAQTAGEITITLSYSSIVDAQMTETYGEKWRDVIKAQIREGWQNRKSEAKERYERTRARLFSAESTGLTVADKKTLNDLYLKQRAFEIEQKRVADSLAVVKP